MLIETKIRRSTTKYLTTSDWQFAIACLATSAQWYCSCYANRSIIQIYFNCKPIICFDLSFKKYFPELRTMISIILLTMDITNEYDEQ